MSAIKKFFQKKKLDVKFKAAGTGHKLTDETRSRGGVPSASQGQGASSSGYRPSPTDAAQTAANAALYRSQQANNAGSSIGTSHGAVKAQVQRELEAEKKERDKAQQLAELYAPVRELELEASSHLAVSGVYFRCPLVGPAVLKKEEMESLIKDFLYGQLAEEPEMTSALMIYTFTKDSEQIRVAVDTLKRYIGNVLEHPGEEKYRKIRVQNKAFQERVAKLEGTQEFLQAAGFLPCELPGSEGSLEQFLTLSDEAAANTERLQNLIDVLQTAEPIRPELDRNLRVLQPSNAATHMEVPREFYNVTPEEIKKEQQAKQQAVEQLGMLRTKEMRERERQRELRRYRYSLMRIRFPDGLILQGTFRAQEKLSALMEFVRECLELNWIPFHLNIQGGAKFGEQEADSTLAELNLAPAVLLHFVFDPNVLQDVLSQKGGAKLKHYLKKELLAHVSLTNS